MHKSDENLIHFVGSEELMRHAHKLLNDRNLDGKVVKKNGETHVFLTISNNERVDLGPSWNACSNCNLCQSPEKLSKNIKYVLYPPMILLPTNSSAFNGNLQSIAQKLIHENPHCTHVAVNTIIKNDRIRRPQIKPVIGDFGVFEETEEPTRSQLDSAFWATCLQNGIFQTWAPLYTMFSRGNITEKRRILDSFASQAPIQDTTVIDLYCGIGYFTFPYAKQSPKVVYCWELNWWSVEGLLRAAKYNNINARAIFHGESYIREPTDQIIIFVEDNQNALKRLDDLDLENVSHINMGLLPDARDGIPVALQLSFRSLGKTIMHLHENIAPSDFGNWKSEMEHLTNSKLLHLEKIKQYSPKFWHICGDFLLSNVDHNKIA